MSRIGTLVALCKEGRTGMARECGWYRHALAPGTFREEKVSALPIAEQWPLKLAMRRPPIPSARRAGLSWFELIEERSEFALPRIVTSRPVRVHFYRWVAYVRSHNDRLFRRHSPSLRRSRRSYAF